MHLRMYLVIVFAFAAVPLWSQDDSPGAAPAGEEEAPMFTPAPVSDEGYSLAFASETPRTNYMRGEVVFETAYDDNILPSSGQAVPDVRYSVWPTISLQQSRSRLNWNFSYSPGFNFYQHYTSINAIDHNLALGVEYRLSPHVTLSVANSFQKASDLLSLSYQDIAASGSVGMRGPNDSIVPPATPRVSNVSDATITYQFGPNAMVGAKGTMSGLWYPDRLKLPGLFDSTAQAGSVFYAHRLSGRHYVGATYEFQRLLTQPGVGETQTQSALLFYTLYLSPRMAVSFFGGPEHSDTHPGTSPPLLKWSPAAGGSVAWHGERTSIAASYAHRISDGGGLSGAVIFNRADASLRWQLARSLTAGLGGSYSTDSVLGAQPLVGFGGHAWSGTASLQHSLGQRLVVKMGYTHLHQSYSSVTAISQAPDRSNVWVSLSYQFDRQLGR